MKSLIILFLFTMVTACGSTTLTGLPGAAGVAGYNSLVALAPGANCANGGVMVLSGLDLDRSNTLDLAEVQASSEVCNGLDGTNGADAPPTAFTPTALLNPCGDAPSVYDEVFLKLSNGTVIASFTQNDNIRLSIVPLNVRLRTTDGDNCSFEINSLGDFTYQSHNN